MGLNEKFFGGTQEIRMLIEIWRKQGFNDEVSNITGLTAGLYRIEAKNLRNLINKCHQKRTVGAHRCELCSTLTGGQRVCVQLSLASPPP